MLNHTSRRASCFVFLLVVLIFAASATLAQIAQPDNNVEQVAGRLISTVTAAATAERVRFTSPNTVVQLRLEVYDDAGQKLVDTEQRGGNVLDWHLQGGAGERVADGLYLCVLTSKNLSGRLNQKLGLVTVSGQATVVRSAAVTELNLRQAQTVGPVEVGEAGLTVIGAEDTPPVTVLANNGNEAQIARTRGALTFRVGDFFSGNDKEQMRLTEEGNLGVGTTKPKVKLDVAGTIRAERVLIAKPNKLGSPAQADDSAQATTAAESVQPLVAGTGTTGRLTKWTDGASGTLGDSGITETPAGLVGIGTTSPNSNLTVTANTGVPPTALGIIGYFVNADENNTFMTADSYGNGPFHSDFLFRHARGTMAAPLALQADDIIGQIQARGYGSSGFATTARSGIRLVAAENWTDANQGAYLAFMTTPKLSATINVERMRITDAGNVGIGTPTPAAKLDVAGDVNTSTQYNIGGARMLSAPGTKNLFAGLNAGSVNTGVANSFIGDNAGASNVGGDDNSFFGRNAGVSNVTGSFNSFFGEIAGQSNTTGRFNTIIGESADVGADNLDHATAIGAGAVVSSSNTIALGRADGSDIVDVPGKLQIDTLATAGSTNLCLNSSSRVGPCSSSLRYKTQVQPFLGGLSILNRLRPITFTWKDGGMRDLGLGAEEVEHIEPLLTFRNKQGEIEGVKYNQLNVVLINAIKEQQEQIKQQQRQIEGLKWLVCRNHRNANVCK